MLKIKTNSLQIIKLNNKTYIPYQLHQLPKWFNKYNTEYFNLIICKEFVLIFNIVYIF